MTDVSAIARDAGVARTSVQNDFDLLIDTLIGYWLPPWKLKAANKRVRHSKFYLFDRGIARAGGKAALLRWRRRARCIAGKAASWRDARISDLYRTALSATFLARPPRR